MSFILIYNILGCQWAKNLEAHVQICVPVVLDVCDTGVQDKGNASDKADSQSDPAVPGHAGRSSEGG